MSITIPHDYSQKEFENEIEKLGIKNIMQLCISFCMDITYIPYFPNLVKLICSCSSITSIPFMEKLEVLICSFCSIFEIPNFPKLNYIDCEWCPNLFTVPNFLRMKELKCDKNLKIKFYKKNLKVNMNNATQHLQGRLYQNMYPMYELLIF